MSTFDKKKALEKIRENNRGKLDEIEWKKYIGQKKGKLESWKKSIPSIREKILAEKKEEFAELTESLKKRIRSSLLRGGIDFEGETVRIGITEKHRMIVSTHEDHQSLRVSDKYTSIYDGFKESYPTISDTEINFANCIAVYAKMMSGNRKQVIALIDTTIVPMPIDNLFGFVAVSPNEVCKKWKLAIRIIFNGYLSYDPLKIILVDDIDTPKKCDDLIFRHFNTCRR